MRSTIYNYLKKQKLVGFTLTEHLPWIDNGGPLYHHNKKHVYVDATQVRQDPLFDAFNQAGAVDEITTVKVYFVNDAKILPSNYDDVVNIIKDARLAPGTEGYTQRLCQVTFDYNEDAIVTTFEFSFRKLITN